VTGGTFYRSYDGVTTTPIDATSKAYPATVSDFRLDKYEITVGRFRKFVDAYSQSMIPQGAGKNPNDPNDLGWDTAWNAKLPADRAALISKAICAIRPTWTDAPGANEYVPITCIDWYEAFAFCIWDGGRLPTEAEWNYAAAGGSEQRVYPWGATAPDCTYANFYYDLVHLVTCSNPLGANVVGSESPKGDGRWGQSDLAGNVTEWTRDSYTDPYSLATCANCSYQIETGQRSIRGGQYDTQWWALLTSRRIFQAVDAPYYGLGARCARNP
jgi:formylglycine-generating enzyme required for sulfatase activity